MKPIFKNITIIGVGLLGGSLSLAIRKRKLAGKIYGLTRSESSAKRIHSLKLGCKPSVWPDAEALRCSDAIILASPVKTNIEWFSRIAAHVRPGTIVMDIGSTKTAMSAAARRFRKRFLFVGCHPMAGSEKKGPVHASERLFESSHCFVMEDAPLAVRRKCERFWKALGSKVFLVSPKEHDRIAAKVSHLPHLMSAALVLAASRKDPGCDLRYAGPGLKGVLRIAGANPSMWVDVFDTNRTALRVELKRFMQELENFDRILVSRDNQRLLKALSLSQLLKEV